MSGAAGPSARLIAILEAQRLGDLLSKVDRGIAEAEELAAMAADDAARRAAERMRDAFAVVRQPAALFYGEALERRGPLNSAARRHVLRSERS